MCTSAPTKSIFGYSALRHRWFGLHQQQGKEFLGGLDKRGVVHPTRTDEYHPASGVVGHNVCLEVGSFDQSDVLRGPWNGTTELLA